MAGYGANGDRLGLTRRRVLGAAAGTAAGALAGSAFGAARRLAPSDRVNVAVIGAGGQGAANMTKLTGQNIVATADVDYDHVLHALVDKTGWISPARQPLKEAYDKAARFTDYRKMFDTQKDIDAV